MWPAKVLCLQQSPAHTLPYIPPRPENPHKLWSGQALTSFGAGPCPAPDMSTPSSLLPPVFALSPSRYAIQRSASATSLAPHPASVPQAPVFRSILDATHSEDSLEAVSSRLSQAPVQPAQKSYRPASQGALWPRPDPLAFAPPLSEALWKPPSTSSPNESSPQSLKPFLIWP